MTINEHIEAAERTLRDRDIATAQAHALIAIARTLAMVPGGFAQP